jgi:hypothetical protein
VQGYSYDLYSLLGLVVATLQLKKIVLCVQCDKFSKIKVKSMKMYLEIQIFD